MTPALTFRPVQTVDLDVCTRIEAASYPADEAASSAALQYRQAVAGEYFRCVCLVKNNNNNNDEDDDRNATIVGFCCATRCAKFTEESMSTHDKDGTLLAIHSVVVDQPYRRQGIATQMLRQYIQHVEQLEKQKCKDDASLSLPRITKMVLLAKAHLLGFYVNCGFTVTQPSPIVHGSCQWYELQRAVLAQTLPPLEQSPCFVVDAFGNPDQRGTGNPAAVVLLPSTNDAPHVNHPAVEQWMQRVAAEFNLSETAFVWPLVNEQETSGRARCFGIRYFTPTTEVPLCGHATLASASVLYQTGRVAVDQTVQLQAPHDNWLQADTVDGNATHIAMVFPSQPAVEITETRHRQDALQMLERAFGLVDSQIMWLGVSPGLGDLLVQVTSPDLIQSLNRQGGSTMIQFDAMKEYQGYSRGIILTSPVDNKDDVDFVSRFFAPKAGIDEEPVTGSAHCVLVPHYSNDNKDKNRFLAQQWSSRGGWLTCKLISGDCDSQDNDDLVEIAGHAVTTLKGNLQ